MDEPSLPLRTFRHAQTPRLPLRLLADQVGVSEGQLSRVEREGTTSLPLAMRLAEVTGLAIEDFAPRSAAQDAAA